LEGLKKLLGESRKATGLETVCFKVKKDRVGELREVIVVRDSGLVAEMGVVTLVDCSMIL
jgi:hypothetical protein